ncbi:hypothetical protein [Vibrio comitans]|uniref:Uncharacterized protein n=1 Tax=Vibrio comitans NBRC 102076 TaxID=1219078 RepID=A0A4Y3IT65_9VIBR|nr:hypothetical protein [Vibrio comitans]GEA61920.1 hypothetical protein VCO01S_31130 [Vibrio comitans NBRC 102076]
MQINTYNLTLSPDLRAIIEEEHMYLYRFNIDILLLQCDIEKLETITQTHQVSLTLYLEDRTYVIIHKDHNLESALEEAFLALQKKLMRQRIKSGHKLLRNKVAQFLISLPTKASNLFIATRKPQLKG